MTTKRIDDEWNCPDVLYSQWAGGPDWNVRDYIKALRYHIRKAKQFALDELARPHEWHVVIGIEIHKTNK